MFNMLLWALILLFSSASFQYSHIIGGINRVFLGLYKAVGEAAVIVYDEFGEETTPHFDTGYFEQSVISYFDTALSSYAANYEVGFSYYCPETGEKCVSRCQEADVYFKCPIPMLHDQVDRTISSVLQEAIPESSRDGRTIGVDVENGIYLLGDITPDYKDYAMQSWHSRFDETLIPRLEEYLTSGDVDYVLLPAEYDGESYRLPIRNFILDDSETFVLYHPSCGDCPTILIFQIQIH